MSTRRAVLSAPATLSYRLLLIVAAGVIGLLINQYPVLILGGLLLTLGQIPALACTLALGPWAGLAAASIAALQYVSWHQYVTYAILVAEAYGIGYLSRRHRPLAASLLFWAAVGVPALLINLAVIRHMAAGSVALVVTKNVIASLFNTAMAAILSGRPLMAMRPHAAADRTLRDILNTRLAMVLTLPMLATLIILSTISERSVERAAFDRLTLEARRYAHTADQYINAHERTVATVAAVMAADVPASRVAMERLLTATHERNRGFLTLLVADPKGDVQFASAGAGAPPAGTLPSVADRAYFREPMRTGRTFVSGVFQGRALGRDIIYAVSAPIRAPGDTASRGVVEGSLSATGLDSVMRVAPDLHVTLIDDQRRVIFSDDSLRWPLMSKLPASISPIDGVTGRFSDPDARELTVRRERLFAVAHLEHGWNVIAETPRYTAIERAANTGTVLFVLCMLVYVAATLAVRQVSHDVVAPLALLESQAANLDWASSTAPAPPLGAEHSAPREVLVVSDALSRAAQRIHESFHASEVASAERDAALGAYQATLRHLDGLVQSRTVELVAERDRAESANRAKSAFLANMSHELRTPLGVILGQSETISEELLGPVSERQKDSLGIIQQQGRHLLSLINDVLDLARIESGKVQTVMAPINVAQMLVQVVESFRESARRAGVVLTLTAPTTATPLTADALRLRQIVINLVGNALKFTPQGGSVSVILEVRAPDGAPVAVHVADTGPGIPLDRQEAVFEAFEQVDGTSTRRHGGTGLGLTISRSLATSMGMRLSIDSHPGSGSTFSLRFADPV